MPIAYIYIYIIILLSTACSIVFRILENILSFFNTQVPHDTLGKIYCTVYNNCILLYN